jgi:molybdenum cofactor cytidylyltransferase
MDRRGVSAILLAAGLSRRMGQVNKLALPVGGEPLLCRIARTLCAAPLREIVAVLGHEAELAEGLLEGLPLRVVHNPGYQAGQMSSVHRGLAALSEPCAGVMVCLADQPLLTVADIAHIAGAFISECPRPVLVPTWQGRRGNPIVLGWEQRDAILSGERNLGCKRLIEKNPELVWPLPMPNDHCVLDLDSPEDYQRLRYRLLPAAAEPADTPDRPAKTQAGADPGVLSRPDTDPNHPRHSNGH